MLNAWHSMRKEANSSDIYGPFPRQKVLELVKAAPWLANCRFDSAELPTLHYQAAACGATSR